jgi:N-acetylneuraminate synthase
MEHAAAVRIGDKLVGDGQRVFVIAEIGINHNGSLDIAKKLIDGAVLAGCDAVKLQKRTPEVCVPKDQWYIERETPWGRMTYIDYRHKVEFGVREYSAIDRYCKERKIDWFVSCWDEESVDFMERFDTPCYKAASASLTDHDLLRKMKSTGKPLMMSTGMSTMDEIEHAVSAIGERNLLVAHSTSTYPCPIDALNLRMIATLKSLHPSCPIGYSGHETGLATTWAAVAMGATFVERHITLDRAMWGTDQAASVEIVGLVKLVQNIRDVERSLGDGVKRIHEGEIGPRNKLRRVRSDESGVHTTTNGVATNGVASSTKRVANGAVNGAVNGARAANANGHASNGQRRRALTNGA